MRLKLLTLLVRLSSAVTWRLESWRSALDTRMQNKKKFPRAQNKHGDEPTERKKDNAN